MYMAASDEKGYQGCRQSGGCSTQKGNLKGISNPCFNAGISNVYFNTGHNTSMVLSQFSVTQLLYDYNTKYGGCPGGVRGFLSTVSS